MANKQKQRIQQSFEAEWSGLFAFIRSKIDSLEESEDLVQEVFVQALSNLNVLEAVDNLTGWLFTVAKNKVIDWYRKKRLPMVSLDESTENGISFSEMLAAEIPDTLDVQTREFVYCSITDAIEQLPDEQKYVFIQQVIEGRTFRELSKETGVTLNTLIARKRYAIRFLKTQLKEIKKLLSES